MTEKQNPYVVDSVEGFILTIRNQKVILDSDLARVYGVQTKALNQAIKRNADRFPPDFAFLLTHEEASRMRSQFVTSSKRHISSRPRVFTEHGAMMAATILNSPQAVRMSLFIVRAFVKMRERLVMTHLLEKHLAEIDRKLLSHDASLRDVYERIRPLLLPPPVPPKRKIGFRAEESHAKYRVGRKG
jgi:hypothetical protein